MCAILGTVALVATGCGSAGSGGGGSHAVTLIVGTTNDNFYVSMNCGAKAEAQKLGVTYKYTGPSKFDASQQIPIRKT